MFANKYLEKEKTKKKSINHFVLAVKISKKKMKRFFL